MFLKQLDIIGFKSFAEKTVIEFVPGVTAVVGPNGSGKSNITDAIRWVLGEQSAKSLRGGKMEDIIFAGSDSRKQLNYAEVTLTLNNEKGILPIAYNEISVARRVFRTGESEYLLNGQVCRLKEIIDLFMDSGLGKEAFSIIGQGKVDEILNSKPEERRSIFEEVAGVLKYKTRKKQAESKLLETSENLNRVNDIIYELEGQIEPLKIQASIAKDYLEKKKELENHEIALIVHEVEDFHIKWQQSNDILKKLYEEENDQMKAVEKTEMALAAKREQLTNMDETTSQLQAKLLLTTQELENLEGRRAVLKERKKNATQNTDQMKQNILNEKNKIKQLLEQQQLLKNEVAEKSKEVENLKKALQEKKMQEKALDGSIEETIETLKSDYIELMNEQASAKNELQYLDQQLQQQIARSERLDGENEKYVQQRNEISMNLQRQMDALAEVNKELDLQVRLFNEVKQQIHSYKKQYETHLKILQQATQFLQKAESRKETLEEMEEEYTGFFQGVKEVLKARDQKLAGIEGAVAELIEVPPQYAVAIETALGSSMQNIIVSTEQHARGAIAFLKQNRYGRATFLPLDILKDKFILPESRSVLKDHSAFIGIAADLVQYDKKYYKAVSNLLGNIIIATDLKGANAIARLLQYRYRIVTVDGDIVNPGGSMTGGATKNKTSSVLSRKTELNELKSKLKSMHSQTEQFQHQFNETKKKLERKEEELELIQTKGEKLRSQKNELEAAITHIQLTKKTVDERLKLYDLETEDLIEEKNKILTRNNELTVVLSKCEKKIKMLNEKIKELTIQRNQERQSKESLTTEITSLSSALAVANEQLHSCKSRLISINDERTETENKLKTLEDNLHWLENELTDHDTTAEKLISDITSKREEKELINQQLSSGAIERSNTIAQINRLDTEVKKIKSKYDAISQRIKDEEIRNNRLDVELENKLTKLREEYSLSYEGAKATYSMILPVDETRTKVKLIKKEIEELGTVNLGAIEEYDRIYERHQFLLKQQNDLTQAKDHLFQVMDEMDEEMKKRFSITFYEIQTEFEGVFKSLFGGGKAELKLTDPFDLLNTGVEIIAQPPGKKLQNLSLLSGGERSLTAIALLFSILKIRPVPFCVLDEVEAALDEANVKRFSDYLQQFSSQTQFIVITHRQGTMQGADVLYGVTMQESGVSKLVSVILEEQRDIVQV